MARLSAQEIEDKLKAIKTHKRISEAPSMGDLAERAEKNGTDLEYLIRREAEQLYLAANWEGQVFLVQNPAVWEWKDIKGVPNRVRPMPVNYSGTGSSETKRSRRKEIEESI